MVNDKGPKVSLWSSLALTCCSYELWVQVEGHEGLRQGPVKSEWVSVDFLGMG